LMEQKDYAKIEALTKQAMDILKSLGYIGTAI